MPGVLPSTTAPLPQGDPENPSGPRIYPPQEQQGLKPPTPGVALQGAPQPAAQPPPMHSDAGINAALMQAFRPIVPEATPSLLGPAIGQLQSRVPPIAYYQPRPVAMRKSS